MLTTRRAASALVDQRGRELVPKLVPRGKPPTARRGSRACRVASATVADSAGASARRDFGSDLLESYERLVYRRRSPHIDGYPRPVSGGSRVYQDGIRRTNYPGRDCVALSSFGPASNCSRETGSRRAAALQSTSQTRSARWRRHSAWPFSNGGEACPLRNRIEEQW